MAAHCHNSTGLPDEALSAPKRVTAWENETVKGMALSHDRVHQLDLDKIEGLRARQRDYLKSLPTNPEDCLRAAAKLLHTGGDVYPEGFAEAFFLSFALVPMIKNLETDMPGPERSALLYVADRIKCGLSRFAPALEEVSDILGNPARLKRDAS